MPTSNFERCEHSTFRMEGYLAPYLRGVVEQWLMVAPAANPGMLEMFADRDRQPYRDMVPWAGEFSGKYLTGAVQVLRLTGDPELRRQIEWFVGELTSLQDEDGYLGPWPSGAHVTNKVVYPDGRVHGTWDTWGHYHNMLGLLLWHEDTGDKRALRCARRMADLLCAKYLGEVKPRLVETGGDEMNLAPAHSLCLLYRATGEKRYLDLARQVVDVEFGAAGSELQWPAGNYLEGPLAGIEFFELPKPRWESLHPIMALVELYYITGEPRYRQAFERIWWSIANLDRHNNGGFSSGEQANGNPFHPGAIETCCTIAWSALSVEMLRLTGDPRVVDELELSLLNSIAGMHSPSGRWATYNTPMDGVRRASAHEIVFQSREGTPELNCCSVNSARGFGLLSDWALMRDDEGLVLNWYGPCALRTELPHCGRVTITQSSAYPVDGRVTLTIRPARIAEFAIKLRIPRWSVSTRVKVNGRTVADVRPASYLAIRRKWRAGDRIDVALDMTPHCWDGELECAGKSSLFRGPILLTYDRRFNSMDPDRIPPLDARSLSARRLGWRGRNPPQLLLEFTAVGGGKVRLCDFGSAGIGGTPYRSWLVVENSARLSQHFASSRTALDCAELQRYACRLWQAHLNPRQVANGWMKPEQLVKQIEDIVRDWPDFRRACDRAQTIVTGDPQAQHSRALQSTISRLDAELGILGHGPLENLEKLKREIVARYKLNG